jgi:hypothetical protein
MFKLIKNNEILAYSSGAVGWGAVNQNWTKISLHAGSMKFCTRNE